MTVLRILERGHVLRKGAHRTVYLLALDWQNLGSGATGSEKCYIYVYILKVF